MSSTEESPAQKAARLRRERREAKIRDGGAARLDKITSLSGRTPASAHAEPTTAPAPAPAPAPTSAHEAPMPTIPAQPQPQPTMPPFPAAEDQSAETLRAQQEYIRALLRQRTPDPITPGPQQQQQAAGLEQDPAMQLLSSLLGGGGAGMPNGPFGFGGAGPGGENGAGAAAGGGGDGGGATPTPPPPSLADLASMAGLPPWLSQILRVTTTQPETPAEKQQAQRWKIIHVLFSVCLAVYLLLLVGSSVATYGSPPPPPAMAQNPWVMFLTGELVLGGARVVRSRADDGDGRVGGSGGVALAIQLLRDLVRDGSILLFVFGLASWWNRGWQQTP